MHVSGLKPGQDYWPGWPTDPDTNPGQTRMWPGLIKIEACAETYMLSTTINGSVLHIAAREKVNV